MKRTTEYVCTGCGYVSPKWNGKCPGCGEWNSLEEREIKAEIKSQKTSIKLTENSSSPQRLNEIDPDQYERISTGMQELDNVFGGGIVAGEVTLISGEPGIGKTTLLLQISEYISRDGVVFYDSAEESKGQIKMSTQRLGLKSENILVDNKNCVEDLLDCAKQENAIMIIADSIQTLISKNVNAAAGSVSQVREVTAVLTRYAKNEGVPVLIVGHVCKDGTIAGPKTMEHIVDAVFNFEGDKYESYRILRAAKNRYGSTNEIGIFEMTEKGFEQALNPSSLFLSDKSTDREGISLGCILEGTRPLIVEIQSLVNKSNFGNARRMSSGVDINRLILLTAVLEKKFQIALFDKDIYLNVVGGLKIDDRTSDLGIILSILSSYYGQELPIKTVAIGEVALNGDVRNVSYIDKRINECIKLGYNNIYIPEYCNRRSQIPDDVRIHRIKNIADLHRIFVKK